jgi:hypothetical protein
VAKRQASASDDRRPLVEGLRKALDGQPRLLRGTAASDALFASAKAGEKPASQAVSEGLVEVVEPPLGVKARKGQQFVTLTEAGRELVLNEDSPRAVLDALLPKVERVGEQLGEATAVLNSLLAVLRRVTAPDAPRQVARPPEVSPTPQTLTGNLESALRQAYEKLRLNIEYRDGLVELPHLYHELRKTLPGLTVAEYHRQLMELWNARRIELHILNEVRSAREPDKGITRNDQLYYYLLWKTP